MRTSATTGVALLLLVASGCANDPGGSDAARRGRQQVEERIQTVLGPAPHQGLPIRAEGVQDSCYAGQDNYEIRDPYRTQCQRHRSVVLGLGSRSQAEAETRARGIVRQLCRSAAALIQPGTEQPVGRSYPIAYLSCNDLLIEAHLVPAVPEPHGPLDLLSFDPEGTNYEFRPVDPTKTLRAAGLSGDNYVLTIRAGSEYYTEPR